MIENVIGPTEGPYTYCENVTLERICCLLVLIIETSFCILTHLDL